MAKKKPKIHDRYTIIKKIGQGTFGKVYHATDNITKEDVAIKIEDSTKQSSSLLREKDILSILQHQEADGIPKLKWFGHVEHNNIMVMELLGPSLDNVFKSRGKKFSLTTVMKLGYQMLCRIEYMHSKEIIHRDIKPQNFVIGMGRNANKVYIIDFGLAKKYVDKDTGEHIRYRQNRAFVGTRMFCSEGTHLGEEQGRKDDLESLGYTLLYFLRSGNLPWNIPGENTEEKKRIMEEIKLTTSVEELCEGYPEEFLEYFRYLNLLEFDSEPDYEYVKGLFLDVLKREGHV